METQFVIMYNTSQYIWCTHFCFVFIYVAQEPAVKELRFATDPGTQKIWTHWYRLQIQGTQMFVMISQGQVGVEVGKNEDIPKYSKPLDHICCSSSYIANPLLAALLYS